MSPEEARKRVEFGKLTPLYPQQRLRLGATPDGKLTAIAHEAWMHSARRDDFTEPVCTATRSLYAAPNRLTRQRVVRLDLPLLTERRYGDTFIAVHAAGE